MANTEDPDLLFGRIALRQRLLQPNDLVRTLLARAESGFHKGVAELLVERRLLEPAQARKMSTLLEGNQQLAQRERDEAASDPRLGSEVAGVRLERVLGKRSLVTTYQGQYGPERIPAVLKLIDSGVLRKGIWIDFLEAVRGTMQLTSPHIVKVLDCARVGGEFAIISRFVNGIDLRDLLNRVHRVRLDEAVRFALSAARGLEEAHGAGIFHMDLKLENMLLARTGHLFLTDFGLAFEASGRQRAAVTTRVHGVPHTMAPELCRGDEADARSDVYALGTCFYCLLTGTYPFEGNDLADLMPQHLDDIPIPPDEALPEIPREVGDLVLSMLSKSRGERPGSSEVVRTLEEIFQKMKPGG